MAFLETKHVAIKGIAACVPHLIEENKIVYENWGGTKVFFLLQE